MKKLTKKSLDELAEMMPVISEKNQQECVGGYYYVDESGSGFLQTTTGGDLMVSVWNSERDAYWASGTIPTPAKDLMFHPVNSTVQQGTVNNFMCSIDPNVSVSYVTWGQDFASYDADTNTMYVNLNNAGYTIAYKSVLMGALSGALAMGSGNTGYEYP